MEQKPTLEVQDLNIDIFNETGVNRVVRNVNFTLQQGETLAIVGESGSGKSLTANAVMGILPEVAVASGVIRYRGEDLLSVSAKRRREMSGPEIGYVFQEPMSALHPTMSIGEQMMRPLRTHLGLSKKQARQRAEELLAEVGIPPERGVLKSYVHQLSGGMRQRVMIAMAISCEPTLLIADEPTTALDATIQQQILDMLNRLKTTHHMSMIMISHDLGLVARYSDAVVVMYNGDVMETGPVDAVINEPTSAYTKGLLAAAPRLGQKLRRLPTIPKEALVAPGMTPASE